MIILDSASGNKVYRLSVLLFVMSLFLTPAAINATTGKSVFGQVNRMQSIGNEIPLIDAEISEIDQQYAFMQWLVENPTVEPLLTDPLNNFLQSSSPSVSAAVRGILVANELLVYNEPYLEPDLTKSVEIKKPRVISTKSVETLLKVYPNPAHDFITIEYNTGNENANGIIEIIDESGRRAYIRNLTRQFDQIILDTRYLKPGNYIIKLVLNGKPVCSTKFVISR